MKDLNSILLSGRVVNQTAETISILSENKDNGKAMTIKVYIEEAMKPFTTEEKIQIVGRIEIAYGIINIIAEHIISTKEVRVQL